MRVLLLVLVAALALPVASSAQAQAPVAPPPPGFVPLVLQGGAPGLQYELSLDERNAPPLAHCGSDCLIYVRPGKYRLSVTETDETRSGRRVIEVYGPSRAYVEPRTKADKESGLIMGIGGSVLFLGGFVGLMGSLLHETHCNEGGQTGCRTDWSTGATISLVSIVAGAILTPIGWVQFGRSSPNVSVAPLQAVPPPPVQVTFQPLRRPDGSGAPVGGLLFGQLAF